MPKIIPLADRFWRKVVIAEPDSCWLWAGDKGNTGYGRFWYKGRNVQATRLALMLVNRSLGDGQIACHICDNPPCVNPAHLFAGTRSDNMQDCLSKGRFRMVPPATHCKRGHEFTRENTCISVNGTRRCRACGRMHGERIRRAAGQVPISELYNRTTCGRGHTLTPDNLYFATEKSGKKRRQCKACNAITRVAASAKQRAKRAAS